MSNYFPLSIILIFTNLCQGHNIAIKTREVKFFRNCNDSDIMNMNDFLQVNLKYDFADDMETMIINGDITVLKDFPQDELIELHVDFLEWKRGKWENTIYSIQYNDFCSVMYDPSELWYPITENTPIEKRICPPVKGAVFYFDKFVIAIDIKNVNVFIEGQFKAVSQFKAKSWMTCSIQILDVWKC